VGFLCDSQVRAQEGELARGSEASQHLMQTTVGLAETCNRVRTPHLHPSAFLIQSLSTCVPHMFVPRTVRVHDIASALDQGAALTLTQPSSNPRTTA
jgi:hypothetical protein